MKKVVHLRKYWVKFVLGRWYSAGDKNTLSRSAISMNAKIQRFQSIFQTESPSEDMETCNYCTNTRLALQGR